MTETGRSRILVVDDNPPTLYSTSRVLRSGGFEVVEAQSGYEALAKAADPIDLVILDVNLPDIDGFEVCRRLRAVPATARIPVIHLSATFVRDVDKVHGLQAGADGYLTHPVEPPVLIATVKAFLRTRQAEDALRGSETKFKAVFENAINGIALLTDDMMYVEANPATASTLGLDREQIVGKHLSAFLPEGSEKILAAIDQSLQSSGVWRGNLPLLNAAGQMVELEWSIASQPGPAARLAITTDISERKLIEAERERLLASERLARGEAERANRLKDDFLAAISHELRTPLNAILGWTRLMRLKDQDPDLVAGLEAIERNVKAQTQMIADLLDVSRIAAGKLRLELQEFSPQLVVDALVSAFSHRIFAKKLTVDSSIDESTGLLVWDLARFQQVVSNLLDNAIKFSDANGTITLRMFGDAQRTVVEIRDGGRGIAPEFLPHVFDRFRQEEGGTARHHGGLGLGLAIVKQLVEAHAGTIAVHSAGERQGATFTVQMPRLALPSRDTSTAFLEHNSLKGVRVFLLEDDDDARELVARILREYGAMVETARSVSDAKLRLSDFHPHLFVSDIGMPGEDGYDFIRFLRAPRSPYIGVPAVALTAFGSLEDRDRLMDAGYQWHLAKPLDSLKLVEAAAALTHALPTHPASADSE